MAEKKLDPRLRTGLVAVALLLALAAGWYTLWRRFADPDTRAFEPIAQQIESGQITIGDGHRIDLRKSFPGVTPRDEIFAEHRSDSALWLVLFPTFYGQIGSIGGVLYTSRPLVDSDTAPATDPSRVQQREIAVGPWPHMRIDKRLSEHWYRVSRKL